MDEERDGGEEHASMHALARVHDRPRVVACNEWPRSTRASHPSSSSRGESSFSFFRPREKKLPCWGCSQLGIPSISFLGISIRSLWRYECGSKPSCFGPSKKIRIEMRAEATCAAMAPLMVAVEDLCDVWKEVEELFEQNSVLEQLEVRNKLGARASAPHTHLSFVRSDREEVAAARAMRETFSCFGKPYAHVMLLPHVELEDYRRTFRTRLKALVEGRPPAHLCSTGDWLVLYIILPGQISNEKNVRKVFEKLRDDFNTRKKERVCLLDLNMGNHSRREPGAAQQLDVEESLVQHRRSASASDAWYSFLGKLASAVGHTLEERAAMADEEARRLSAMRNLRGWSFPRYFLVKEGLANMYASIGMHEDALREYLELGIILGEGGTKKENTPAPLEGIRNGMGVARKGFIQSAILGALALPVRQNLNNHLWDSGQEFQTQEGRTENGVLDFDMRRFITANQLKLLFACRNYEEMISRGLEFIQTAAQSTEEQTTSAGYLGQVMWAFYACIELGQLTFDAFKCLNSISHQVAYINPTEILSSLLAEYGAYSSSNKSENGWRDFASASSGTSILKELLTRSESRGHLERKLLRALGDIFLQARKFFLYIGQLVSPALVLNLEADFQALLGVVPPTSPAKVVEISEKPVRLEDVHDRVFRDTLRSKEGFERLYLCMTQVASLAFRESGHARTSTFLDIQSALLLLHARDHEKASTLFSRSAALYRKEGWTDLLAKILPFLLECQENLGDPSQISVLLEILSLPDSMVASGRQNGRSYWAEKFINVSQKPDFRYRKKAGVHALSNEHLFKVGSLKAPPVHVACGDVATVPILVWSNFTEPLQIDDMVVVLCQSSQHSPDHCNLSTKVESVSQVFGSVKLGSGQEEESGNTSIQIKEIETLKNGVECTKVKPEALGYRIICYPKDLDDAKQSTLSPGMNRFVFEFVAAHEGQYALSHLDLNLNTLRLRLPSFASENKDDKLVGSRPPTKLVASVGPAPRRAKISLASLGGVLLQSGPQWVALVVEPLHDTLEEASLRLNFMAGKRAIDLDPQAILVIPTNKSSGVQTFTASAHDLRAEDAVKLAENNSICIKLPRWAATQESCTLVPLHLVDTEGLRGLVCQADLSYTCQLAREEKATFEYPLLPPFDVTFNAVRISVDKLAVQSAIKSNIGLPLRLKEVDLKVPPDMKLEFNSCENCAMFPLCIGPLEEFNHFFILVLGDHTGREGHRLSLSLVHDVDKDRLMSLEHVELHIPGGGDFLTMLKTSSWFDSQYNWFATTERTHFQRSIELCVKKPDLLISVEHITNVSLGEAITFEWKVENVGRVGMASSGCVYDIFSTDDWTLIGRTVGALSEGEETTVTIAAVPTRVGELRRPELSIIGVPSERVAYDHRHSMYVTVVPPVPSLAWLTPMPVRSDTTA